MHLTLKFLQLNLPSINLLWLRSNIIRNRETIIIIILLTIHFLFLDYLSHSACIPSTVEIYKYNDTIDEQNNADTE